MAQKSQQVLKRSPSILRCAQGTCSWFSPCARMIANELNTPLQGSQNSLMTRLSNSSDLLPYAVVVSAALAL